MQIQLTNNRVLYGLKGVAGNIYILEDYNHKVSYMIDCGMISDGIKLIKSLKHFFPLQSIFCTHFHVDHISGWFSLKAVFNDCTIFFHEKARPFVFGEKRLPMPSVRDFFKVLFPCMKDSRYFPGKEDILSFHGTPFRKGFPLERVNFFKTGDLLIPGVEILHTPGHRPESVSFFEQETGILICGDLILSVKGKLTANTFVENSVEQQESVSRIKKLSGLKAICPGHGNLINYDISRIVSPC